jgi:hypothetical protein
MAANRRLKASFAAGELAPELYGRAELRAFENGARRLANVVIQPTGGVARRAGLRHLASLPGPARIIGFELGLDAAHLAVLTDALLILMQGDAEVARIAAPWTGAMLAQMAHTQSADALLLLHPDMPPQRLARAGGNWTLAAFPFLRAPLHRFVDGVAITPSATSGTVTLTADAPFFQAGHAGQDMALDGQRLRIVSVSNATTATASVIDTLLGTGPTTAVLEAAIGPLRGWPVTACFHQDRLVLGGVRDLTNRLFFSRTGAAGNFDTGTGLDDQAIAFGLVSDQAHAIRGVFSGRHLQVFTSGAEWMVTGDPLTPASIQLHRQTRVGSPVDRMVPPVDVDGATLFVARAGQGLVEFAYTDLSDTYQANDLALVARHLMRAPQSMAYDQAGRLLHVVMADGSMATLTLYRAEQVTAWTRQETAGAFRAVAEADGRLYLVVERLGVHRLERFDAALGLDAAIAATAEPGRAVWPGLDHLEGSEVGLLADGAPAGSASVAAGSVTLDPPAAALQAGLPFTHVIEPLPIGLAGPSGSAAAAPIRLVAATFRLLATPAFAVDLGRGAEPVPFRRLDTALLDAAPSPFTGDITLRALGWRRDAMAPLWRVEGSTPLPMVLLSVTTEMRMKD